MEDRIDIPKSFWERLVADKRRLALVSGGVLLAVALIGGLVFARMQSLPDELDGGPSARPGTSTPTTPTAEETGSPDATGSASATSTPGTDPGTDPGAKPTPGGSVDKPVPVRASFVAFRLRGSLYIAREDGSEAKEIAQSASGEFALAPNGKTLAVVNVARGRLVLVDIGSGKQTDAGPALDEELRWAPDSLVVAYSAQGTPGIEARTVSWDGSGSALLGEGHSAFISADSQGAAWIADALLGQSGKLVANRLGSTHPPAVAPNLTASEVAFGSDGVFAVVQGPGGVGSRVVAVKIGAPFTSFGSGSSELPITSSADKPTTIAHMCPSPDGAYLTYAEVGDDGYSRAFVYDVAKKTSVALSTRRDTYPLCWSADGSRMFFVEGNAFQGERTALMSVLPDGMGRKVVVEGAGL